MINNNSNINQNNNKLKSPISILFINLYKQLYLIDLSEITMENRDFSGEIEKSNPSILLIKVIQMVQNQLNLSISNVFIDVSIDWNDIQLFYNEYWRKLYSDLQPINFQLYIDGLSNWELDDSFYLLVDIILEYLFPWHSNLNSPNVEKWETFIIDNFNLYIQLFLIFVQRGINELDKMKIQPNANRVYNYCNYFEKMLNFYNDNKLLQIIKNVELIIKNEHQLQIRQEQSIFQLPKEATIIKDNEEYQLYLRFLKNQMVQFNKLGFNYMQLFSLQNKMKELNYTINFIIVRLEWYNIQLNQSNSGKIQLFGYEFHLKLIDMINELIQNQGELSQQYSNLILKFNNCLNLIEKLFLIPTENEEIKKRYTIAKDKEDIKNTFWNFVPTYQLIDESMLNEQVNQNEENSKMNFKMPGEFNIE
ncbi:hypothetical protein K502DRAFT_202981 [Neoconidiobolus thromboides FSU 785]|nr:hypothetical protein K502DRAFT_202981 [Neoconidiobolus thromboides FSU 785]